MEIFITHQSALQYWRLHEKALYTSQNRVRRTRPPTYQPNQTLIARANETGIALPINIMVSHKNVTHPSSVIRHHVLSGLIPANSFVDVGNGLFIGSPELCFFQMANTLSMHNLIQLGYELCGTYSLPETVTTETAIYNRKPLTSKRKLDEFVSQMNKARGQYKAERALRYIDDGSASPMETALVMLLTLPNALGGYGLPTPKLNARIVPAKANKHNSSKSFYSCDLLWLKEKLAVEYDSNQYHTGAERISNDARRRNSLSLLGINVITVTSKQIHSPDELEIVARQLASSLNKRLRLNHTKFSEAQHILRQALFQIST
ncbi:MAG: hypothetical protein FWD45_05995 [Coriobacteriia bacterium]|nr:hypothetical protein [Coriobacteriia bacterium]